MSHSLYNAYWSEATEKLSIQLDYENPTDRTLVPNNVKAQIEYFAMLYARYILIYKKLEAAYDQIVHPQKRITVRKALIATIGRMLETKKQLVELENSDTHVFNELLRTLKLNPQDLEIPTPRFYREELRTANDVKVGGIEAESSSVGLAPATQTSVTLNAADAATPVTVAENAPQTLQAHRCDLSSYNIPALQFGKILGLQEPMGLKEAILLLQTAERGRQNKRRALVLQDLEVTAKAVGEGAVKADYDDANIDLNQAARNIQRVFRGFRARKIFQKLQVDDLVFLGMKIPSTAQESEQKLEASLMQIRANRKELQTKYVQNYKESLVQTKAKIHSVQGPAIKEALQDSFRQWYMEFKRQNGKFPEFPPEALWKRPDFYFGMPNPAAYEESNEQVGVKGDSKKPSSAGKGAKGKDGEATEPGNNPFLKPSHYRKVLEEAVKEFNDSWKFKNEADNTLQVHDQEQVKEEKRLEVEAEMKNELLESLEEELNNLAIAVDKASKGKGKSKNKGKAKGKGKAGGKKGKKEKDLTADRTMASLVQELVDAGIMKRPVDGVKLANFEGSIDPMAQADDGKVIPTSLADVRRNLVEYCILPHGYNYAEEEEEFPGASSVMICGQSGSGKTMLVNAVANELGGCIFDLTPKVTAQAPNYQGKDGIAMMLHVVHKVARAHAPSVIYIDDVERIFAKKVPKDDTSDPKRIKKDLTKLAKKLAVRDGIVLIATSSKPWEADAKAMVPLFQKVIAVPYLSYGERINFWKSIVERHAGKQFDERKVSFAFLAHITEGLSYGDMDFICQRVFSPRRVKQIQLRKKPFQLAELIDKIFESGTISSEPKQSLVDFLEKLPLQRKRLSANESEQASPKSAKAK